MSTDLSRPSNPRRCLNCGSHVTLDFRRTHGDERNRAHRCRDCDTYQNIASGSAAGSTDHISEGRLERGVRLNRGETA